MKIHTNAEPLREAVKHASAVLPAKQANPAFPPSLRLSTSSKGDGSRVLTVLGVGEEGTVEVDVPATFTEGGDIWLDAKHLARIIASDIAHKEDVTIEAKAGRTKVTFNGASYILLESPAASLPDRSGETYFDVAHVLPEAFRDAVKRAAVAAARESTRYSIDGILLDVTEEGVVHLAATDGRRLTLCHVDGGCAKQQAIFQARILTRLAEAMSDAPDRIAISSNGRAWAFTTPSVRCELLTLERRFPDYMAVIPQGETDGFTLTTAETLEAVKRAGVVCDRDLSVVEFSISGGKLRLNGKGESSTSAVAMDLFTDLEAKFNVNPGYFADGVGAISGDNGEFSLFFTDDSAPIKMLGTEGVYVLMPVTG